LKNFHTMQQMKKRLAPDLFDILKEIGATADKEGVAAYGAGGFVRDFFLRRNTEDIDIVIEGNAIEFAKKFAQKKDGKVCAHEQFKTASVIFANNFKIDFASARIERYKSPAALPEVETPASIQSDLFRRDFTINALAIGLSVKNFGTLLDPFSGKKDIEKKRIKILHGKSFIDDPSRIFRAIKFAQRFGFKIDSCDSEAIKDAVKNKIVARLSGTRLFSELKQILKEEDPVGALIMLDYYNITKEIHPDIRLDKKGIELFALLKKKIAWHKSLFPDEPCIQWALYFLILIDKFDKETSGEICSRFQLSALHRKFFCENRLDAQNILYSLTQKKKIENNRLYKRLSIFKTEIILYMMAKSENDDIRKVLVLYYTKIKNIRISITGNDLIKAGFKQGPIFAEIMNKLLDMRIEGKVETKEDELEFIKDYYEENCCGGNRWKFDYPESKT